MDNNMREKQKRLFLGCQYARLCLDLNIVKREIAANSETAINKNDSWFKQIKTATRNKMRNYKREGLIQRKSKIEQQLYNFRCKNCNEAYAQNYDDIKRLVEELFVNDQYGLQKTLFSVSIVFDCEYDYEYDERGLRNLSREIWNSEDVLLNIRRGIENNYLDLSKRPLSTTQKMILAGSAVLALAAFVVPAVGLAGANASAITSGLAGAGAAVGLGGMAAGVAVAGLSGFLVYSAIVCGTYYALNKYNQNEVKKEFRKMSYSDVAFVLAIKCYLIQSTRMNMPKKIYKESANEILQMIQDLKSDTDYMLFIERQDTENNKEKIQVFHNLDKKFMEIFAI